MKKPPGQPQEALCHLLWVCSDVMFFLLGKTCVITIPKSIDIVFFSQVFSFILFFPSFFILLLSSQGLAHMMAEQGMPLFSSSLSYLCFVCDSSVELHDLVLVWNICESAWLYTLWYTVWFYYSTVLPYKAKVTVTTHFVKTGYSTTLTFVGL